MSPTSRRDFVKTLGGLSLAGGAPSWLWAEGASRAPAPASDASPIAASVRLTGPFRAEDFRQPESVVWPGYFWLWNAPLDPVQLRAQLQDMAVHEARSVCMLPMPHGFRPDSTNNDLRPDYLTPDYFARVALAVDEAARLGLAWWLYDEGGWPSGQALGQVVAGHPELTRRTITREKISPTQPSTVPADALALVVEGTEPRVLQPGQTWSPHSPEDIAHLYRISAGGGVDLLNPAATGRFIALTHDRYAEALGAHLGRTVKFTFTDEPGGGMPQPPQRIPWFPELPQIYETLSGRSFLHDLPWLFAEPQPSPSPALAQARLALYDALTQRYAGAYFAPLQTWARQRHLASGGHLGGEDETFGAIKYSFGHLLRQLRHMDVPGVDLIWRQLFPGRENQSNFPLAAATIAHQNGTRFAFSESFCVYGNGLTPAQMKWLTDYQYLRGINLLVIGCYPLSTRDHHMTGERPHFGPMNPLWDHLRGYHAYVARLGYLNSMGRPFLTTALYYPAREMWSAGLHAKEAVASFEAAGQELMERQCPCDLLDDDTLLQSTIEGRELVAGAMRYQTIVCGQVRWMLPAARQRLAAFAAAGGQVLCVDHAPGSGGKPGLQLGGNGQAGSLSELGSAFPSLVNLHPASRALRVSLRASQDQRVVIVFNEGSTAYHGAMAAPFPHAVELEPAHGTLVRRPLLGKSLPLDLSAGETRAFLFSKKRIPTAQPGWIASEARVIDAASVHAVAGRQVRVGEHDFEWTPLTFDRVPLPRSGVWKTWLSEDFSGEVDYQCAVDIPATWRGSGLQLETGPVEYAATVLWDGQEAGHLLWAPWRVMLPSSQPGRHTLIIRVANTLANELTSERVAKAWTQRRGPGWPSPYHERAIQFEKESRGGGFTGPIRLTRLTRART